MYVPGFSAVDDDDTVRRMLQGAGVGHLVTSAAGAAPVATLVPFLVDDELRSVRAHLARANPQWRGADGVPALLLVPVSSAYVSPSWYPSKATDPRVVPTWNYEVVHVEGTLRVHDDPEWVLEVVRQLTDRHESHRSDDSPRWSVDDAPSDYLDRQARAIVGIELEVGRVEAKRKLSQNRSTGDRAGVVAGLDRSGRPGDRTVADAMRSVGGD